jgi:hypothetical protein
MENEILLSFLKSQLRIEETKQRVYGYATDHRTEYFITQEIIWELNAQIRELEAIPDVKPIYYITDEFASDKGLKCRYYVRNQTGMLLNNNALHINDAELLCKLANNQTAENGITIAKKYTTLAVTESELITTIMGLIDQSFEKYEMIIPSKVNKAIQKELQENLINSLSA